MTDEEIEKREEIAARIWAQCHEAYERLGWTEEMYWAAINKQHRENHE